MRRSSAPLAAAALAVLSSPAVASAQDGAGRPLPELTLERMAREAEQTAPEATERPGFFATLNESFAIRTEQQLDDGHHVAAGLDALGTGLTAWSREDGERTMAADLRWAVQRYDGQVVFEDPQRHVSGDFWQRLGWAEFNRAPPSGVFPGGIEATRRVRAWLHEKAAAGGTTQRELMLAAIEANAGNATLAMGSIAEVLHHERNLADAVAGLGDPERKDYYRFVGAYVGLQPNPAKQVLGWIGSHINIAGNAPLFLIGTLFVERSFAEAWRQFLPRARWGANAAKVREFNVGAAAAGAVLGAQHAPADGFRRSLSGAFGD